MFPVPGGSASRRGLLSRVWREAECGLRPVRRHQRPRRQVLQAVWSASRCGPRLRPRTTRGLLPQGPHPQAPGRKDPHVVAFDGGRLPQRQWVFCSKAGTSPRSLQRHEGVATGAQGGEALWLQALRPATELFAQGGADHLCSRPARTHQPTTTLRWYAHWLPRGDKH
jgi:hypothetical protein